MLDKTEGFYGELCRNCSSATHKQCCVRCGALLGTGRLNKQSEFCSAKCETDQIRDDKLSMAIEKDVQNARLNASTVRGLRALRSLADVTVSNGIDMTLAEVTDMKLAIGWLDKQLDGKGES